MRVSGLRVKPVSRSTLARASTLTPDSAGTSVSVALPTTRVTGWPSRASMAPATADCACAGLILPTATPETVEPAKMCWVVAKAVAPQTRTSSAAAPRARRSRRRRAGATASDFFCSGGADSAATCSSLASSDSSSATSDAAATPDSPSAASDAAATSSASLSAGARPIVPIVPAAPSDASSFSGVRAAIGTLGGSDMSAASASAGYSIVLDGAPVAGSAAVAGVGALSEKFGRSGGWATFALAVTASDARSVGVAPADGGAGVASSTASSADSPLMAGSAD